MTQAQINLYGQLQQAQSMLSNNPDGPVSTGYNFSAIANQKASASATSGPLSGKPKQKKSAKKHGASQGAQGINGVVGHMPGAAMLMNGTGTHFGQPPEQFGGGFRQNSDHLNSKSSNYYTVINQTLASQVASSMNNGSFAQNDTAQRRGEVGTEATTTAGSKRKSNKNTHGGLTKSVKDSTPVHESAFIANDRSAQTSIDWKHAKKKGIHLGTHPSTTGGMGMAHLSQQPLIQPSSDKNNRTDFAIFQDHLIIPPKTQSGRPNQKKLAT